MDQRTMIYWAACIDSTLYLVGVFALGVWQNHPWACILAVACKGVSYLGDALLAFGFETSRYMLALTVALGALAGAMAI